MRSRVRAVIVVLVVGGAFWAVAGGRGWGTAAGMGQAYEWIAATSGVQPIVVTPHGRRTVKGKAVDVRIRGVQSGDDWFVWAGEVSAEMRRAVPRGASAEIDVDVNGQAVAEISLARVLLGNRWAAVWATYELFSGGQSGLVLGDQVRLSLKNYVPLGRLKAGRNHLGVSVWQFGGQVLRSAELSQGSRFWETEVSPAKLVIGTTCPIEPIGLGEVVPVTYVIRSGGLPARAVGIMVRSQGTNVSVLGPVQGYLGWVTERHVVVPVIGLHAGTSVLTLEARGLTGSGGLGLPAAQCVVHVMDRSRRS